jgi:hypothetical protein
MHEQPTPESPEELAARVGMRYLSGIPAEVPSGRVVVHNSVRPARRLGVRGFRAWTQWPDERLEVCGCDWAPEVGEHYRVKVEGEGDD